MFSKTSGGDVGPGAHALDPTWVLQTKDEQFAGQAAPGSLGNWDCSEISAS